MVPAKTHQFRTRLVEVQLPSESCWVMSTGIAGVREYPKSRDISWYFMIFHDMSVYFMICQYISWFLWFHGISWLLKGGVAATEPSGYVPGLQRFRCRRSPGHVGHGGTPNHPKVDRSGIESHGDLGILLKRNLHFQHPKVHPESRPGAPIGPQGVVGAIFLVPTRIY